MNDVLGIRAMPLTKRHYRELERLLSGEVNHTYVMSKASAYAELQARGLCLLVLMDQLNVEPFRVWTLTDAGRAALAQSHAERHTDNGPAEPR